MSDEQSNKDNPGPPRRGRMGNYWIYVLLFAVGLSLFMFNGGSNLEETTWKTFSQKMLAEGDAIAMTSDAWVLDNAARNYPLAGAIIDALEPLPTLVDCSSI